MRTSNSPSKNSTSDPLVSVIVPTKNSSEFLERCLRSIKAQTYPAIELIVVDNHSTDRTPLIAKKYADTFFTQGPERSAQRNFGAAHAHGKYVAIIDSDMELSPGVIGSCVSRMRHDIAGIIIPEESVGIGFWAQCKRLERSLYLGVPSIEAARFFSRALFINIKGYNEDLVSGEDWDLSQRAQKHGPLERADAFIYHQEGRLSLIKTMSKKYYYAQHFARYAMLHRGSEHSESQGVLRRYVLFFSHPKELLKNPILGLGMLYMKTCEFAAGAAGYAVAQLTL